MQVRCGPDTAMREDEGMHRRGTQDQNTEGRIKTRGVASSPEGDVIDPETAPPGLTQV